MKANPKAYFPSKFIAAIAFKKVDAWAFRERAYKPYFDTWDEAHTVMVVNADKQLAQAKRDLLAAERYSAKVARLKPPPAAPSTPPSRSDEQGKVGKGVAP